VTAPTGAPARRSPLLLVVAAVVLVALGIGVGVLITGGGDSGGPGPGTTGSPSALPGGTPTSSASAAMWADDVTFYDFVGGIRLPRSASAGPRVLDGHLASGFAHSPQGSVMAAINIAYRCAGIVGEPIWRPTIEQQVVGPDQAALLARAQRNGSSVVPPPGERIDGSNTRIAGFELVSYTPDAAAVRYMSSELQNNGQPFYAALEVQMRWTNGDWRMVAPLNGDPSSSASRVLDTAPFILFRSS
jgi:hypothetical protein